MNYSLRLLFSICIMQVWLKILRNIEFSSFRFQASTRESKKILKEQFIIYSYFARFLSHFSFFLTSVCPVWWQGFFHSNPRGAPLPRRGAPVLINNLRHILANSRGAPLPRRGAPVSITYIFANPRGAPLPRRGAPVSITYFCKSKGGGASTTKAGASINNLHLAKLQGGRLYHKVGRQY